MSVEALVREISAAAALADPESAEAMPGEAEEDEVMAAVEAVERAMRAAGGVGVGAASPPSPVDPVAARLAVVANAAAAEQRARATAAQEAAAARAREAALPDADWFAARTGRTARLRSYQASDGRPYWVRNGQLLLTVVRQMGPFDRPSFTVVPAAAIPSGGVGDSDDAVLAVAREARAMQ